MPDKTTDELKLDSAYFAALEMGHSTLSKALAAASDLNVTQYRILVKTFAASPESVPLGDMAKILNLKPNVVTQATDTLEAKQLVERRKVSRDARVRTLSVTPAGEKMIAHVNEALVAQLYADFPTENPVYRKMLEASITAGTAIEPPLSDKVVSQYPASRTLVSFELIRQTIESAMAEATHASFNDCRILQRLYEVGSPLRSVDLANQLMLPAVTITRTTTRLVEKGWVQRFSSPDNKRAVFVATTAEGIAMAKKLDKVIDEVAYQCFWSKLDAEHRHALCEVGHIAVADRRKREAEAVIDRLQEI